MADKRLSLFLNSDVQPPPTDDNHVNLLLVDLGGGDYGLMVGGAQLNGNVTVGDITVTNFPDPQNVAVANGADVTLGAKADAAATDETSTASLVAIAKALLRELRTTRAKNLVPTNGDTSAVSGDVSDSVVTLANFMSNPAWFNTIAQVTITAYGQPIMFLWDGQNPTATDGHYIPAYGTAVVEGLTNVQNVRMIRADDATADARVTVTPETPV